MANPSSKRAFTWVPHPDNAQKVLLALCAVDLAFFCYYLFNFELDRQHTISDTLFADGGYRAVLTVLLAFRLTGVCLFLARFRHRHCQWQVTGYAGACLAMFGWMWLVWHRDNTQHFTGVGIFCVGSFGYSLALVRLAATSRDKKEVLHACMDGTLLLYVVVLVVSFVMLWVEEEQKGLHSGIEGVQSAYIVEHGAYIAQVLFLGLFFLYHSPDQSKEADEEYIGSEDYDGVQGTPMVCRPLIPGTERVLAVIQE